MVPKNNQTDYWRDFDNGGNQEPNETLTNVNAHQEIWEYHSQRELLPPHLFPEDAYQTKVAPCFEAHTKQANEHHEK